MSEKSEKRRGGRRRRGTRTTTSSEGAAVDEGEAMNGHYAAPASSASSREVEGELCDCREREKDAIYDGNQKGLIMCRVPA